MISQRGILAGAGYPLYGSSYKDLILNTPGLLAYWPLDDASGTIALELKNGYNAAYINTPILGAAPIAKGLSNSVTLNGTTQYVELATPPAALNISTGSIEAWVNFSLTPNGTGLFTTAYGGAGTAVKFALGFSSSLGAASGSYPFVGCFTTSVWIGEIDEVILTDNAPHHVIGTFEGTSTDTTFQLFIDGVLVALGTIATAESTLAITSIYMGRRWDTAGSANFLEGSISNFAMYSSIITPSIAQLHYNRGIV